MAEYLSPNHEKLSISAQRYIFAIRNRMIDIENNFPNKMPKKPCFCGKLEDQEHIYSCELLNEKKETIEYNRIFEDNVNAQKKVYEKFRTNFERRNEKMRNDYFPSDPSGRSTIITNPSCNSNGL